MRPLYAQRVNRLIEKLFDGAAPCRWCVFPHGTVVMFEATVPAVKLVAEAQHFIRRNALVHAGSPSGDFDPVRLNNFWLVNFEAPTGVVFFGVLLDSTRIDSAITAGLAQRHAREMDALCSPVCTSSNFVELSSTFVLPCMQIFDPQSNIRNDTNDNDDTDSNDTDDNEDYEEAMERMYHSCE